DEVVHFSAGLAIVRKAGKTGYIDKTGKLVIPLMYLETTPFNDRGTAEVSIGQKPAAPPAKGGQSTPPERKWGIIDKSNNKIVEIIYDQISPSMNKGLIMVVKDGAYGFIDATGKEIIPPK